MKTKAELKREEALSLLTEHDKDDIILTCMHILDGPEPWESDTIEWIAEQFTKRGFNIRDCNDESQFEESELRGKS
jgi:hypothetical protein